MTDSWTVWQQIIFRLKLFIYNNNLFLFFFFFPLFFLFPLVPFLSAAAIQECESEIRAKSALVSKLEDKTMDISRMLMRLDQRGAGGGAAAAPPQGGGGGGGGGKTMP